MNWLLFPPPPPAIDTELERLRAKIAEVFDVPVSLMGAVYDGEFIPTGPVVESTIEEV